MHKSLMNKLTAAFITIFAIILTASAFCADLVSDEIIISVKKGSSPQSVALLAKSFGGTVVKDLGDDIYLIKLGLEDEEECDSVEDMLTSLCSAPAEAASVLPNLKTSLMLTPNDEYWKDLWGHKMIHMPQAWDTVTGSDSVTVAVVDCGVSPHPDLEGRLVPGKAFVGDDPTFIEDQTIDDDTKEFVTHGTMVSGVIAANGNNGIGVAGVCMDGVKIMPIKVIGVDIAMSGERTATGSMSDLLSALEYLRGKNVQVLNMSIGYDGVTEYAPLEEKCKALANEGKILVAASGNESSKVCIPAACPSVVAVGAIDSRERLASFSNYGPGEVIDLVAPGVDIKGLDVIWDDYGERTFDYHTADGTSFACPYVSGAAALLLSKGVAPADVIERLKETARTAAGGSDREKFGAGVLDVFAALRGAMVVINSPADGESATPNANVSLSFKNVDVSTFEIYVDFKDEDEDHVPDEGAVPLIAGDDVTPFVDVKANTVKFIWTDVSSQKLGDGYHTLYVSAKNGDGETVSDFSEFVVEAIIIPGNASGAYHMVAFPFNFMSGGSMAYTVDDILTAESGASSAFMLCRWIPTLQLYATAPGDEVTWDNPIFDGVKTGGGYALGDATRSYCFPAGSGFWVKAYEDIVINSDVSSTSEDNGYVIYLYPGWNMIGNPYAKTTAWRSMLFTYKGQVKTFTEAVKSGWIGGNLYGYDTEQTVPAYYRLSDTDAMKPYEGYWLKVHIGGTSDTDRLTVTVLP
ncbi:MAG: S8 family serine peptidase [Abditibacteriota bacterium]|nr:S8 family serine peptidase [Abditibacteriota bacterium]